MSHRVVDFHDDLGASFSAASAPAPELLKTASYRETYELQDGDFALIIVDEAGKEHRKFACHDTANTWMSLWYLENVESGLPEYAKVAAAENLAIAAGVHEINMEEMFPRTAALSLENGTTPFRQRSWVEGAKTASRERLDERRVVVRNSMPVAPATKVASAVDKVAEASRRWEDLSPWERRVVALTLENEDSGSEFPAKIAAYMGHDINPNILKDLEWRAQRVARTEQDADNYVRVGAMAKAGSLELEDAVEALFLLDEQSGLTASRSYGPGMPDPYLLVYGGLRKEAMWSWTQGDAYVNEEQLKSYLASSAAKIQITELMTQDLVEKLRKDPVKTFDALPSMQKKLIARMATNTSFRDGGAFRT